ncbi:MAG: glutaminase domain-containing protein [Armatimonadota bacterium]
MTRSGLAAVLLSVLFGCVPERAVVFAEGEARLRPPAVPLVAGDPYFSIWSFADGLTDSETRHWTGRSHPLHSLISVDGKAYRLMGAVPDHVPPVEQVSLEVLPTRTIYRFRSDAIWVTLTFMTAALPHDLDVYSRPVTYITWDVRSADGKPHRVALYYDNTGEIAVNTLDQPVVWTRANIPGLDTLRVGSAEQPVLRKRGDDLRIDWGYLYAAAKGGVWSRHLVTSRDGASVWAAGKPLEDKLAQARVPTSAGGGYAGVFTTNLGEVGSAQVSRWLMLAYDDLYSIEYFYRPLRPYWRRRGLGIGQMLTAAARDYPELQRRCAAFDRELMRDLTDAGGERFARIAALAYRQCVAANKLAADATGRPLLFPKENFSNGCISTVDVIYPMSPMFLLLSPTLMKAALIPVLDYAVSDRWRFPFAPHDLGTYPIANGQVYGGGERTEENQMPVEECGNMILMVAALAKAEGSPDLARKYWAVLTKWAQYLREKGLDPENQLCTDDFAGHLAHNVNLSAKAICALGAYALLCDMVGKSGEARQYRAVAQEFARQWVRMADDGDHFRLAFDRPGTWSQKYNLVWDRVLGLGLFPREVLLKEMRFYLQHQNRFGLPLDNRRAYTKLDWILWTAALTGNRTHFETLVAPVYDFLNETPDRVPMTDWYWTTDARKAGFQARPVVGGVFMRLLDRPRLWRKWAGKSPKVPARSWAPLPKPPRLRVLAPTSQEKGIEWRYTTNPPDDGWFQPDFDDSTWQVGQGGFGTAGTPGAVVRTVWNTGNIWLRRELDLKGPVPQNLRLLVHHDEDAEVYINGVLAAQLRRYVTEYELYPISTRAVRSLRPGRNVIAVHCRQTVGGQYIDVGIVSVEASDQPKPLSEEVQ